jgi:hypothetical protein
MAQAQAPQPNQTTPVLPPPPAPPAAIFVYLTQGYNPATAGQIMQLVNILNMALHYSSMGQANFQKIMNNALDLSGAAPDELHIGNISKYVYANFLNNRNSFTKKIAPNSIHQWADTILNGNDYSSLTQVKPNSELGTKVGNLRETILISLNKIKDLNPISAR